MKLTADQHAGAAACLEACDAGERSFMLSGPAGSGKTTLVRSLLDRLPQPVAITAPTHQAVKVLRELTGDGRHHYGTIHSLLGLRPVENDRGETWLRRRGTNKMPLFGTTVLDEVSQVGRDLHRWIDQEQGCTFLLSIGDPYQLPPVKETASPLWKTIELQYRLTTIVRQAEGSAIRQITQELVRQQDTGAFGMGWTNWAEPDYRSGAAGVFCCDFATMEAEFRSDAFKADPHHCKILTYTNAAVIRYNRRIRKAVIGETETPFIVGEVVVNRSPLGELDENNELQIDVSVNSEMTVLEIAPMQHVLRLGRYWSDPDENVPVKVWRIVLDTPEGVQVCYMPQKRGAREMLVDRCVKAKRWLDRRVVLAEFPDLRHSYASTVHTAQGATYDIAFVDVDDIARQRGGAQLMRLQLLYVAASRPRTALVLAPSSEVGIEL